MHIYVHGTLLAVYVIMKDTVDVGRWIVYRGLLIMGLALLSVIALLTSTPLPPLITVIILRGENIYPLTNYITLE